MEAYGFQSDSWRVSSLQATLMWERLTVISAVKPSLIVAAFSNGYGPVSLVDFVSVAVYLNCDSLLTVTWPMFWR
jgi:hypothetical protein